jgi:transcription initiation factor TFIIB
MPNEGINKKCPECGGEAFVRDYVRGELVCARCGFVLEERSFDFGPEWRAFNQEQFEERARTGPPEVLTLHDKGLTTTIYHGLTDFRGKQLSPEARMKAGRLRKWQVRMRLADTYDRSLAYALGEINRMGFSLGLPNHVIERAAVLYRQAAEKRLIKGRSVDGMAAAVLYAACRESGLSRSFKEIAAVSKALSRREISKAYVSLTRELQKKFAPADPAEFVPRLASEIGLSEGAQAKAIEIIRKCEERGIAQGRNPNSVAAAATYIAGRLSGEHKTQDEVVRASGLTQVTIRNVYKRICSGLGLEHLLAEGKVLPKPKKRAKRGVQNIVLSVEWKGAEFDLDDLAKKLEKLPEIKEAKRPKNFPGTVCRLKRYPVSFLVFKSAKANCTGAKSVKEAKEAIAELTRALKKAGFEVEDPAVKVQNVVVAFDLSREIDVSKAASIEGAVYNPESFPGVAIKVGESAMVLLFASGRGICAGAKSLKEANQAIERVRASLFREGGQRADRAK